jgi:TonB family protein
LGGSVSLGNFGVGEDGQVNHVQDEPNPDYAEPIISCRLEGDTLAIVAKGKSGSKNSFQMKLAGHDEAKIKWSPAAHQPFAPEPGWWTIARAPAKTENEVRPGGPSSGVVGGVPGGVVGGVPGGAAGKSKRIKGEVAGTVSGVLPGRSGQGGEKEALLQVPKAGLTEMEAMGMSSKPDRFKGTDGMTIGQTVGGLRESNRECSVSGTVEDPSGGRLPNAVVTLLGELAGSERTAATDHTGEFLIDHVAPGSYRLMVRYPNFERAEAQIKVVAPENKTVVNVIMSPRGLMEWVSVKAKMPAGSPKSPAQGETDKIREGGQLEAGKPIYKTEPVYPENSKREGIQGDVTLEAVISTEGVPMSIKVIKSPNRDLADAAVAAVKQWRYQPAKLDGVPVEVVTDITVRFGLEN